MINNNDNDINLLKYKICEYLKEVDESKRSKVVEKIQTELALYFGVKLLKIDLKHTYDQYKNLHFKDKNMEEKDELLKMITCLDNTLRYYQKITLGNFVCLLNKNNFFQAIIFYATGLGKTKVGILMFLLHNKKYLEENVLWICHRKDIIESLKEQLDKLGDRVMYYDDKKTIKNVKGKLIVILRQSLIKIYKDNNKMPKISGIIHDECHNATSDVDKDYETTYDCICHITTNNNFRYRVGLSATPLTSNICQNSGMLKLYGSGNRINYIYKMTLFDGVSGGWLLKPKIIYVQLDNLSKLLKEDMKTVVKYVANMITENKNLFFTKGLVWVDSVENVHSLSTELSVAMSKKIKILKSTATHSEHDRDFTNKIKEKCVMVACDKFSVGFNGVNIEFGINLKRPENGSTFLQKIGRFLRKKDNDNQEHGIFYQFYESGNVDKILDDIVMTIIKNFENIESVTKNIVKKKYKITPDEFIKLPELNDVKAFLDCIENIEAKESVINYENILKKFLDIARNKNKDDVILNEINEVYEWIELHRKYPTKGSSSTKDKKIKKLEGEIKVSSQLEKLKKGFSKMSKECQKKCLELSVWIPFSIASKESGKGEYYEKLKNVKSVEYCEIVHKIARHLIKGSKFSNVMRNEYGKKIDKYINKDKCVTTLEIFKECLERDYAVNGNEKTKLMRYICAILEKVSHVQQNFLMLVPLTSDNDQLDDEELSDEPNNDQLDNRFDSNISVKSRPGQQKYKDQLLNKFGSACIVAGDDDYELLQACHIKPHSVCNKDEVYDVNNGLILSANVHCLLDTYKLSIDPVSLKVVTHSTSYKKCNGKYIKCLEGSTKTLEYLKVHYDEYLKKLKK